MDWWEKFFYIMALAFWRAYFDVREAISAVEEVPNEKMLARANNFRDAVKRLRDNAQNKGDPGSPGPPSSS